MLTLSDRAKDLALRINLVQPGTDLLYRLIYEEFKQVYRDAIFDKTGKEAANEPVKMDGTVGLASPDAQVSDGGK